MLRSIGGIRRDPLTFLTRMQAEFGDVMQFPIPTPPTYLVADVDAVRRVLVTNARAYGKRTMQYTTLSLVTGEGLLTADTEAWRTRRPLVQPAFHHDAVARIGDHVAAAVARLRERWDAATGPVDVEAAMLELALEVVGSSLFGTDLTGQARRLATATVAALDQVVARVRMPWAPPLAVPTPGNLRLRSALRRLDAAVEAMLAERAARPRPPGAPARDMLDLLLAGGALTTTQVRDEIVTFIVAGHETVATALTWAWYLLGRDPAAARALAGEAARALPADPARLGQVDPAQLPYARAVLDEVLRLYPPAWLITRRAAAPDRLGGIDVPAGALVLLSPWLLHRDRRYWPEPAAFRPQRFAPEAPPLPRGAYLPFGAGPRQCIGRDLALREGVLVLAALARHFRLEPVGPDPVLPLAMVTVRPAAGLPMRPRSDMITP
jgi:cytochrome P450